MITQRKEKQKPRNTIQKSGDEERQLDSFLIKTDKDEN